MKKIFWISLIMLILLLIPELLKGRLAKPETNLEFWIGENVDDLDHNNYEGRSGLMGGIEFYGTGYFPVKDEYGYSSDPEHCVIYTITNYPDYASNALHITRITITDPSVNFYGLSLNSSFDEIKKTMDEEGFKVDDSNKDEIVARKGKFSFIFSSKEIFISARVSNIMRIQF